MNLDGFFNAIGFNKNKIHYNEIWISTAGGFLGIVAIFISSQWFFNPEVSILIVPSMGASAVLLFAAPHAPFSQPWNMITGHAVSALIGVACWQWIPDLVVAASASVGLAIGAMYLTRSIHPPGGATALAAVIGSDKLHALGFAYEIQPVLTNVMALLFVAILFNGFFKWRRYPAKLNSGTKQVKSEAGDYLPIMHEDFVYALSQIDTFVDISEEDLVKIYQLATKRHQQIPRDAGGN